MQENDRMLTFVPVVVEQQLAQITPWNPGQTFRLCLQIKSLTLNDRQFFVVKEKWIPLQVKFIFVAERKIFCECDEVL